MNSNILILLCVVYALGFYVMAFVMSMIYEKKCMKFLESDWITCLGWPIYIPFFIVIGLVVGLLLLCNYVFSRIEGKFPIMMKYARSMIFTVSLIFRPVKLGEIVGKRIWK